MSVNERFITVTDKAAAKLRGLMVSQDKETSSVRLALVRTRCMGGRGFGYEVAVEDFPTGDDVVSEDNGIRVCVDPASANYLVGAELDYVEASEFKVNNPNIIAKCPCGRHDIFE